MQSRQLPTGGLAALAAVLAALAVLVVTGARVHLIRPTVPTPAAAGSTTTTLAHHVTHGSHTAPGRPATTAPAVGTVPPAQGASTPTTLPRTATSTTTTSIPAPTTTVPAPPVEATSRAGLLIGGADTVRVRLGPDRRVTVVVEPGVLVTLTVSCGVVSGSQTSSGEATVTLHGGSASCSATFRIPPSSPRPARWRLVAS